MGAASDTNSFIDICRKYFDRADSISGNILHSLQEVTANGKAAAENAKKSAVEGSSKDAALNAAGSLKRKLCPMQLVVT